jgi:hypothetical protein
VTQEGTRRGWGNRTMKLKRAVRAEEVSRRRGITSVADYPITLAATVRRKRKDQNATSAVSVDTLRRNALNNREPWALSMRRLLVRNA